MVQACNEENKFLEEEFESVEWNIEILQTRIQTDKHPVDAEVAGVGYQMHLQEAGL
jgi:hypothetical protein